MDLLVFNTTLKNVVKTLAQPLTCLCKSYNHFYDYKHIDILLF